MRAAEDILEDILESLEKQGGVAHETATQMRQSVQGSGAPTQELEEFGDGVSAAAAGVTQFATGLMRGADETSKRTSDMAGGLSNVVSVIPGVGTAFSTLIDGANELYQFMNTNLDGYKKLNEAGLQTTDGMMGLYSALASSRLTQDEFMNATAGYRDVMASMGADGMKDFGGLLNTVIETQSSMGMLNMSNETMAKSLASVIKQQKDYGVFDNLNKQEQALSARKYMDDMNSFSKSLGMSVNELTDIMGKSSSKAKGLGVQMALVQDGMDPEKAAAAANNFNMVAGSLGEFGTALSDSVADMVITGKIDLDSTFGKIYQVDGHVRDLVDEVTAMAKNGSMATEEGAKRFQEIATDPALVESLKKSMQTGSRAFGNDIADVMGSFATSIGRYDKDIVAQDQQWDNFVNAINMTVDGWTRSLKMGISDMFIGFFDPSKVEEIVGSADLAAQLNRPVTEIFDAVGNMFGMAVEPLTTSITSYMTSIKAQWDAIKLPTWQEIATAILPEWVLDIIGDQGEIKSATNIADKLSSAVDTYVDGVTTQISGAATGYATDVADSVSGAMTSMYDGVAKWWSKPSSQTTIEKTVVQQKQSAIQPVSIPQPALATDPLPPASNTERLLLEKLEEVFKPMIEAQRAQASALSKINRNTRDTATGLNAAQAN